MLKKDEVSKYTVPKNALDMLEWPPYSSKYTAKDIPMTDSNIQPPSTTDTGTNPVPGTEVTTSPGLVPETVPAYDPNTANVDIAVTTEDNPPTTVVPPTTTGTEWDGTIAPPPYTAGQPDITEVPPTDYAAAVDYQVNTMPTATEGDSAHQALMQDPVYAVATHEHQLNKIANMLEELCARVVRIEEKINEHENDHLTAGSDNPIADYPEVTQHGGAPGLTA